MHLVSKVAVLELKSKLYNIKDNLNRPIARNLRLLTMPGLKQTTVHVLMTPVCGNKMNIAIYNRQAFAASLLKLLHQVYEKILNCINQNVYLPKLVELKLECRGVLGA